MEIRAFTEGSTGFDDIDDLIKTRLVGNVSPFPNQSLV
jgi:hypothetical protein